MGQRASGTVRSTRHGDAAIAMRMRHGLADLFHKGFRHVRGQLKDNVPVGHLRLVLDVDNPPVLHTATAVPEVGVQCVCHATIVPLEVGLSQPLSEPPHQDHEQGEQKAIAQ